MWKSVPHFIIEKCAQTKKYFSIWSKVASRSKRVLTFTYKQEKQLRFEFISSSFTLLFSLYFVFVLNTNFSWTRISVDRRLNHKKNPKKRVYLILRSINATFFRVSEMNDWLRTKAKLRINFIWKLTNALNIFSKKKLIANSSLRFYSQSLICLFHMIWIGFVLLFDSNPNFCLFLLY